VDGSRDMSRCPSVCPMLCFHQDRGFFLSGEAVLTWLTDSESRRENQMDGSGLSSLAACRHWHNLCCTSQCIRAFRR